MGACVKGTEQKGYRTSASEDVEQGGFKQLPGQAGKPQVYGVRLVLTDTPGGDWQRQAIWKTAASPCNLFCGP
jgi:hypothetical protein